MIIETKRLCYIMLYNNIIIIASLWCNTSTRKIIMRMALQFTNLNLF